jgi:hypothetical protein
MLASSDVGELEADGGFHGAGLLFPRDKRR